MAWTQSSSSEYGEKWQNSGCVLKLKLIRFAENKLKVWTGYKKKHPLKNVKEKKKKKLKS